MAKGSPRRALHWLEPGGDPEAFPPVEAALDEPPGLVAAGGDLSVERLVAAYRRGIFPWYSPGQPILWWSPDPREVLYPAEFRRSRSLAKRERNAGFEVRWNTAFAAVLEACAAPRESDGGGTWITEEMRDAYVALHEAGIAHSVETWRDKQLVGGLYGVRLGGVFFGESMFSRETDASKIALSALVHRAPELRIELIDCQMPTRHLASLGSRALSRDEFLRELHRLLPKP
ncbi:MAG: leucyl/phenylalanyl-tRNA--protein transferase [Gammaproteobacteria bacterium]|nr:leucyl/phenylalanyl-tRNA--protein transferase [Gammaproteobacteria bacterium]